MYCEEGILFLFYSFLGLFTNVFIFKINIKNLKKINSLYKAKKAQKNYNLSIDNIFLSEFISEINYEKYYSQKLKELILVGKLKLLSKNFYKSLLKFQFRI